MLGKLLQQLTHKKILICSFLSANAKRFEMAKEMERRGKPLCPQPQRWQHFSFQLCGFVAAGQRWDVSLFLDLTLGI